MNVHEFFVQRWEKEQPAFSRVMQAIPGQNLDYKPHEKNSSAGDLAWQLAEEQRGLAEMMETGSVVWEGRPRPKTIEEIIAAWDKWTETLRERLKGFDEKKAASPAKFVVGGNSAWDTTIGNMLWEFLFDMVHHRGQISVYLRPMGGKVPSIYGPTADSE
jgi:uncharacterized damage-inducible protein DinB